jgi:site-specific recombinase XerD
MRVEQDSELPEALDDLWHDFRRSLARRNRSESTVKVYRKSFDAFWRWAIEQGITDPGEVDHRTINAWTDYLLTAPAIRNGRPILDKTSGEPRRLEASTRRIRYSNLRPFFTWYAKEFDTNHPFDRADAPGDDRPTPIPVVPIEDVRRILATATNWKDITDTRDAAIVRVLYDTGARLGELVNITQDGWDKKNDFLTLKGKTGTRVVPVSPSTGEAISRYLRQRKNHPQARLPALWLGSKGALGPTGVAQMLRRRCELAGIDHINPHRFRHTWAHTFRAEGGSEGDLMYLAGWSSTAMAHRYGRSAANERAQDAARSLNLGDRL